MRARKSGFEIRYVPKAKVWHKISSSTGGQLSRRKISLKLRSSMTFFGRYSAWYHWFSMSLFFAIEVLRIVILILRGRIKNTVEMENASGSSGEKT